MNTQMPTAASIRGRTFAKLYVLLGASLSSAATVVATILMLAGPNGLA